MFEPTTSEDSGTATSSPASADGRTPSDSPLGPPIAKSGPDPAPANRSAWRAEAQAPPIRATFGQRGFHSSNSAALARSLLNRLRARTASTGSTLFRLRWRESNTPSGRLIYRLRALDRRNGDSGFGWWPTTSAQDGRSSRRHGYMLTGNAGTTLYDAALLATGWATPASRDWKDSPGMAIAARNPDGSTRSRTDQLPRQALLADSGSPATGSRVATAARGRLNPAHSRWLMGYPGAWDACGVTAMRSCRSSPPK